MKNEEFGCPIIEQMRQELEDLKEHSGKWEKNVESFFQ